MRRADGGGGLYDESLVIVTSDHGDLLGQHGQMGHGFHLFQGEIRIPLIVTRNARVGGYPR
jgi:arylsulfatase A-like enzyme